MPIGSLRSAAAAALCLCGLAASAVAAPDAPLSGLPILVDAAGKAIGPYLPNNAGTNSALISVDKRILAVPANNLGFFEARYILYYKTKNCSGEALMSANTLPLAGMQKGVLYYPAEERVEPKIKSRNEFVPNMGMSPCGLTQTTGGSFAKVKTLKVDELGFKAPFSLKTTLP